MFGQNDSDVDCLISKIEEDLKTANILNQFQLGIALKVIEDRLWSINTTLAQKCNNLQHKILEKNGGK
jgi:hypothetical protein